MTPITRPDGPLDFHSARLSRAPDGSVELYVSKSLAPQNWLEIAGEVVALGEGVTEFAIGDKVCALTNGGGYAEYCAVPAGQTLPIQFAQSLSQSFLGINMKCASCHDSFIEVCGIGQDGSSGLSTVHGVVPRKGKTTARPLGRSRSEPCGLAVCGE